MKAVVIVWTSAREESIQSEVEVAAVIAPRAATGLDTFNSCSRATSMPTERTPQRAEKREAPVAPPRRRLAPWLRRIRGSERVQLWALRKRP